MAFAGAARADGPHRPRGAALLAALALATGCGYTVSAAGRLPGGVAGAAVPPFENLGTEPDLGVALAAALREELAARGLLARSGAPAVLAGSVRVGPPSPAAPGGAAWRVTAEVRARLLEGERLVAERSLSREAQYAAGADPLETEGRRALALRALAADFARELAASLVE